MLPYISLTHHLQLCELLLLLPLLQIIFNSKPIVYQIIAPSTHTGALLLLHSFPVLIMLLVEKLSTCVGLPAMAYAAALVANDIAFAHAANAIKFAKLSIIARKCSGKCSDGKLCSSAAANNSIYCASHKPKNSAPNTLHDFKDMFFDGVIKSNLNDTTKTIIQDAIIKALDKMVDNAQFDEYLHALCMVFDHKDDPQELSTIKPKHNLCGDKVS